MRVVLITQDEPFFLGRSLDHLLGIMPGGVEVVGCVLLSPSPFGKRETLPQKLWRTYRIFGAGFVAHYVMRYALTLAERAGRVEPVLSRHGVPILRLEEGINAPASLAAISAFRPDLLVSVAGNEIFRRPLLDLAPQGCLNLHSALLPRYRGLLPSFWVLKNRERESGVSVFQVDEGIDSGPILVQRRIDIAGLTQEALIRQSKRLGVEAVAEAIRMVRDGEPPTIANDDADASYFTFPTRKDVSEFRKAGARFY